MTTTSLAAQGLSRQTPDTVAPSGSPVQGQDDQHLAQESAQDPGLAQLEAVKVPAPAISGGWPRLAVANTPETWATEVRRRAPRHRLRPPVANGAWAVAASRRGARCSSPAVPASAADKMLFATVLDPQPGTVGRAADRYRVAVGSQRPVRGPPDRQRPAGPARSGLAAADRVRLAAARRRMDILDVSGLLTVTRGLETGSSHFTIAVSDGSARWHAGYGTVAVDGVAA